MKLAMGEILSTSVDQKNRNLSTKDGIDYDTFLNDLQNSSHQKARKEFLIRKAKTLTLDQKVEIAKSRIRDFLDKCDKAKMTPVISFSGGKDSCVLRHLVQGIRKDVKLETAAELFNPEIAAFLKTIPSNEITIYKPLLSFKQIIKKEGFPCISKEMAQKINNVRNCKTLGNGVKACFGLRNSRKISKKYLHFLDKKLVKYELSGKCCSLIKGAVKNSKFPKFIGTTIEESQLRRTSGLKHGCNFYSKRGGKCRPISLFTEDDVGKYIDRYNVQYSSAYGDYGKNKGKRTGCVCCGFGLFFEQEICEKLGTKNRIELLEEHYPNLYRLYIHKLKMYKPFCDAGIKLEKTNDEKYKKHFKKRQKQIEKGYSSTNFRENLSKILEEIEKRTNGKFADEEKDQIFKNYGETGWQNEQ